MKIKDSMFLPDSDITVSIERNDDFGIDTTSFRIETGGTMYSTGHIDTKEMFTFAQMLLQLTEDE